MAYLCDYVQLYGGISTIMFWVVHDHVVCDDHVAALPYADACSLSARCLRCSSSILDACLDHIWCIDIGGSSH